MMNKKEEMILKELKKRLLETKRVTEDDFFKENERETKKCIYYLRSFENNVLSCYNHHHLTNFGNGAGGELNENKRWHIVPMASLRSSAALTWNIFGDEETCRINQAWGLPVGLYELEYEWNKSETIHGHFANLDAYLRNGNCHLFVEMKMLEPLTKKHPFKSIDKYLEKGVCQKEFQNAIKRFQKEEPEFFDAFQMLKHLLAIYNHFKKLNSKDIQKVVLLNCHWEPSAYYIEKDSSKNKRGISLKEIYEKYQVTADRFKKMESIFVPLFESIGVDLRLEICNHRKLIEMVARKDDSYLERYNI